MNTDAIIRYVASLGSVVLREAWLDYFNKVAFECFPHSINT